MGFETRTSTMNLPSIPSDERLLNAALLQNRIDKSEILGALISPLQAGAMYVTVYLILEETSGTWGKSVKEPPLGIDVRLTSARNLSYHVDDEDYLTARLIHETPRLREVMSTIHHNFPWLK